MKRNDLTKITLIIVLLIGVFVANLGCDVARGGADIALEGVTLGNMAMEGKPVAGLPSQKVNILLKVRADKVSVKTDASGVTLSLSPSGATVEIGNQGVSIKGVKPEQIEVQWPETK